MNREQIEQEVTRRLEQQGKGIHNRNAMKALFQCFRDPVGALGTIFLGSSDALAAARSQIQQDIILTLLCRIDEALTEALHTAEEHRLNWTVVSGRIQAHAESAKSVTGVHITGECGPVELRPGTHISASAGAAESVTGLRIGGNRVEEEK